MLFRMLAKHCRMSDALRRVALFSIPIGGIVALLSVACGDAQAADLRVSTLTVATNTIRLKVGYSQGYTNKLDIFTCTDVSDPCWSLAATNLATVGGTSVIWSAAIDTAHSVFLIVGDGTIDSDEDGLADTHERLMYRTSITTNDTDGDGMADGTEIGDGTDPTNSRSAAIAIYVNTATGSNANDGLSATWDGTHGPKQSIGAALVAAYDGGSIDVTAGTYTNEPSVFALDTRSVTLIPRGSVIVK